MLHEGMDTNLPTRVEDLWFSRDTIVIRADDKIFQVSRAILAARSTVFRDMIAFPQPVNGEMEEVDGSPVVRMHDPAADVEVFLRAIFDSSYFMPSPCPVELSVVLGILRLSHKYDVQYLFRRALHHLAEGEWYALSYDQPCIDHIITGDSSPIHSLSVAVAAIEVGAWWLLPMAYYDATCYGIDQLLALAADGALQPHAMKCAIAQARFLRGTSAVNQFLTLKGDSPSCGNPGGCDTVRRSLLVEHFDLMKDDAGLDPLGEWDTRAKTLFSEAAREFWAELPGIFDLPPWPELDAMKRAAMGEDAASEEN
ncbi:hypothetical protein B0H11DRAFT_1984147 [Mycena galericulata]|nr:hypothetical protein B0H11DRAFT_1984147 [Mycena galericulata]